MSTKSTQKETEAIKIIGDQVILACTDFFSAHGIDIVLVPNSGMAPNTQLVGLIGFSGPFIKGMVGIGGPISLFEKIHPLASQGEGPPATRADVCDWLAEIANQLLGRVANRVIANNIVFSLSTPSVLTGDLMSIVQSRRPAYQNYVFMYGDLPFSVLLDMTCEDALPLLLEPQELINHSEGEALLF